MHKARLSDPPLQRKITSDLTPMSFGSNLVNMQSKKGKAVALLVKVDAVECSKCHTVMFVGKNKKIPVRCSNRATCGSVFRKPQADVT